MATGAVYNYDSLGRLTNVTFSDGGMVTYNYDNEGNRTSVVEVAESGCCQHVRAVLQSSDLLNLFTTAFLIQAAPPAGFLYAVHDVSAQYKFGTTPYSGGGSLEIGYGTTPAAVNNDSVWETNNSLMTGSSDFIVGGPGFMIGVQDIAANIVAQQLAIINLDAPFTGGDGTLIIDLWFTQIANS
jgi:hypothetical protein